MSNILEILINLISVIENNLKRFCMFFSFQTNVGDILLAVNPFKELNLYDKQVRLVSLFKFVEETIYIKGHYGSQKFFIIGFCMPKTFHVKLITQIMNRDIYLHVYSQHSCRIIQSPYLYEFQRDFFGALLASFFARSLYLCYTRIYPV